MAKTESTPNIPKPSTPKSIPSRERGGRITENRENGTGPRIPKGK